MRPIALLLAALALVACSDSARPTGADASPDAATDGGIDGAPGAIEGTWRLTWGCLTGCPLPAPALTYSDTLIITSPALAWRSSTCADCTADHTGAARGDDCLDVAATSTALEQLASYSACVDGSSLDLTISVLRIGGTGIPTTWHAAGRRP